MRKCNKCYIREGIIELELDDQTKYWYGKVLNIEMTETKKFCLVCLERLAQNKKLDITFRLELSHFLDQIKGGLGNDQNQEIPS